MQALCFLAGANSIFVGGRLLTTPNPEADEDARLIRLSDRAAGTQHQLRTGHPPRPSMEIDA